MTDTTRADLTALADELDERKAYVTADCGCFNCYAAKNKPTIIAALRAVGPVREALEFYRDEWVWDSDHPGSTAEVPGEKYQAWQEASDKLTSDKGDRARTALSLLDKIGKDKP